MSDKILGIIGPLEGKGNGRVTRRYSLVFTENEILCVKIGGTLSIFATVVGEAVAEGYGLSTITDVYNHILGRRVDRLKEMQVQDILDADNLNFSIPYNDLDTIEVKKRSRLSPRGRMTIDFATKNKTYWFRIVETSAYNNYVNLINTILPDKIAR
jgi:hypothetical protein